MEAWATFEDDFGGGLKKLKVVDPGAVQRLPRVEQLCLSSLVVESMLGPA